MFDNLFKGSVESLHNFNDCSFLSGNEFYKNQRSMRRPLFTLCNRLVTIRQNSSIASVVLLFVFAAMTNISYAQTEVDPVLTCLNNYDEDIDGCAGQYEVDICIDNGTGITGESYYLSSPSSMYDPNSSSSCNPVSFSLPPEGLLLNDEGSGIYCLTVMVEECTTPGYRLNIGIAPENLLSISVPCYPEQVIVGASEVCVGNMSQDYTVDDALDTGNSIGWAIDGTSLTNTDDDVTIDWSAYAMGAHSLTFIGESVEGCGLDITLAIDVFDLSDQAFITGPNTIQCGLEGHFDLNGVADPNSGDFIWDVDGTDQPVLPSMGELNYTFDGGPGTYTIGVRGVTDGDCIVTRQTFEVLVQDLDISFLSSDATEVCLNGGTVTVCIDEDALPVGYSGLAWGTNPADSGPVNTVVSADGLCIEVTTGTTAGTNINVSITGTAGVCGFADDLDISTFDFGDNVSIAGDLLALCGDTKTYTLEGVDAANLTGITWSTSGTIVSGINAMAAEISFPTNTLEAIGVSATTVDGCFFYKEIDVFASDIGAAMNLSGDTYHCVGTESCYTLDYEGDIANEIWELVSGGGVVLATSAGFPGATTADGLLSIVKNGDKTICVTTKIGFATPYMYTVQVRGELPDGSCDFTAVSDPITIEDEPLSSQIACNNLVNITVNAICELEITADMILEGVGDDVVSDQYNLTVSVESTGEILENNLLDASYIGQTLIVMVQEDCAANSCWGKIFVEDKSVPAIPCPADITANCTPQGAADYDVINAGGSTDITGVSSVVLTNADDGTLDPTTVCFTADKDGKISFAWDYVSASTDAALDPFGYTVNGVSTQVTEGIYDAFAGEISESGDVAQSSSSVTSLSAGDVFCFVASTEDGALGAATTTVTNILFTDWINCNQISDLSVTGFPDFESDVIYTQNADGTWTLFGFDNCTNAVLSYEDSVLSTSCAADQPGTVINRTWTVEDAYGSKSTCDQTINVCRPNEGTISWPPNYDSFIAGANASLDACGDWATDDNGNPAPSVTGYPDGVFCLNLSVLAYEDYKEIEKCGPNSPAKKILRRWIVWDDCTGTDYTHTQIITLVDHEPPVKACPQDVTLPADAYSCGGSFKLFPRKGSGGFGEVPYFYDCSAYTLNVEYLVPVDGTAQPDPNADYTSDGVVYNASEESYTIPSVNGTAVWIRYVFEDVCFNTTILTGSTLGAGINSDEDLIGTDDFGSCYFEVFFEDVTPPTPICDVYSVISLNEDGYGKAGPGTFDDHSWDNCGIDTMQVRRMDDNCGNASGDWQEIVEFCCADAGSSVMVALGIWDAADNFNQCMVEIIVKDPFRPVYNCPSDTQVDCEDSKLSNLSLFGMPTVSDNCAGNPIELPADTTLNDCKTGTITRKWNILEGSTIYQTCEQVITVGNLSPFSEGNITWPRDTEVSCSNGTDPESLSAVSKRPTWSTPDCSNVVSSHSDQTFEFVDDACLKILRTWTVIDWCNNGKSFTHTQAIKVNDSEGPGSFEGCANETITGVLDFSTCEADVDILVTATDNCTADEDLIWSHSIDYGNDGSVEVQNVGSNDASGAFETGDHRITFTVIDHCDNIATCTKILTIADDKNPTPYCLDEVVIVINPASSEAVVWADDINSGSYDGCNGDPVDVAFSTDITNTSMTWDCDHPDYNGATDTFFVQMYVIDMDGNYDFCTTKVIVQDNADVCTDDEVVDPPVGCESELYLTVTGDYFFCEDMSTTLTASAGFETYVWSPNGEVTDWIEASEEITYTVVATDSEGCTAEFSVEAQMKNCNSRIGGEIYTEFSEMLNDVDVEISANLSEFPSNDLTIDGEYAFENLSSNVDYLISPQKEDVYINGVSTVDIVLIQRHILSMENLNSPYKLIAADVDNSESISANDIAEIRKLILGVYTEFPNNSAWRFVREDFQFNNSNDPFPYDEEIQVSQLNSAISNADFIACKIGDVNESVQLASSAEVDNRNDNNIKWSYEETSFDAQTIFSLPIIAQEDFKTVGLQTSIAFNASLANLLTVIPNEMIIGEENISMLNAKNGEILISWNANENVEFNEGDILFYLQFEGLRQSQTTNLMLGSHNSIKTEVITITDNGLELQGIVWEQNKANEDSFVLYQNKPNPFSGSTTISFTLPEDSGVEISVMDITGKVLFNQKAQYNRGYNELLIDKSQLNNSGVLYYQVDTKTHSASNKMILIK